MTLALYGKSRKRRGGLLLAAFLAVMAATVGGLAIVGSAFAHNSTYTAATTCDGSWTASAQYSNGGNGSIDDRRLIVLHNAKVNGVLVDGSTATGLSKNQNFASGPDGTNGVVLASSYSGSKTGATISATDYIWVGSDLSGTLFSLSGGAGTFTAAPGAWAGTVTIYLWNGTAWQHTDSSFDADITAPSAATGCTRQIKIIKFVNGSSVPSNTFAGTISGGSVNNWSVGPLSGNNPSGSQSVDLDFSAHTVNEVLTAAQSSAGFSLNTIRLRSGLRSDCSTSFATTNVVPANETGYTICVYNDYTATSTGFLTISAGTCTPGVTNSWQFHVIGQGATVGQGGTLTVNYHYDGEAVDAHTATQAENDSTPGVVRWRIDIPFNGHSTITIDHMSSGAPSNLTWDGNQGNPGNNPASAAGCVTNPSVATVKTHTPAGNVAAGGTFHWLLTTTVANGPTNQPVHITDTLPAGMTAGAIALSGTGTAGKLTCTAATGNPDCTIATAAGNGTYIIDVTVTAPAANNTDNCHAYINTASANYGTAIPAGSPTDTVTVTGCANPGISILKTDSVNHTVVAGGAFNYVLTVTVTNGPTTQAYGIADTAPTGLTFGAISKSGSGDLTKLTGNASGNVAWTLATGATNGTYILTIATTAPAANVAGACKLYTNTGSVTIVGVAPMTSSDDVTVTGCNRTLKIYKAIQGNAADNTVFTTSVSGVGGTFPLAQNAHQETSIDQQSHTVTETLASGYSNVSWNVYTGVNDICSDHGPAAASGTGVTATVPAGASNAIVCFVNVKDPTGVTIKATKIVCTSEADLPDFPFAGRPIDASTATTFLSTHPNCHAENGWAFEYGFGNPTDATPVAAKQPGNTVGAVAPASGWNAFDDTNSGTFATATVTNLHGSTGNDALWVREALKSGYLPFSDDSSANPSFSADIGCYNDAVNYDNYDSIDNITPGNTYYCVAWNVAVRKVTILKDVSNVTDDPTTFSIKQDALANPIGTIAETGPALVASIDTGAHTFTETLPAGYAFDGYTLGSCSVLEEALHTSESVVAANTAFVPAGTGDVTICFHNHKVQGQIIVGKINQGGVQSDQFTAHIDGGSGVTFSATAFSAAQTVSVGNHDVTEDSKPGYTAVGWGFGFVGENGPSCTDVKLNPMSTYPIDAANVPVTDGGVTVVCFVNDGSGKLIINKTDQVGNHNTVWHFTVTGPDGSPQTITGSGSATITGLPVGGTYSVTETEANTATCPVPNEGNVFHTTISDPGSKTITAPGQTISFSFINQDCSIVLSTGNLIINKYGDTNGNHVLDAGESGLANWSFTVTGPQFPGGQVFLTNASGQIVIPGIKTGTYTIVETNNPGYSVIGSVDAGGFHAGSTTGSGVVAFSTDTIVNFFNQPLVNIRVTKGEIISGLTVPGAGWAITLTGCGVNQTANTDANGNVSFTNLPLCATYVVSENTASKAGYVPASPATVNIAATSAGQTYSATFLNSKIQVCLVGCFPTTVTPTTTPTSTPTNTPTATPTTATAVPTTVVPNTATPTPTITESTLGEKTPGPGAKSTPLAPSTGSGLFGNDGGSMNVMLALFGIIALSSGLATLAFGRKNKTRS